MHVVLIILICIILFLLAMLIIPLNYKVDGRIYKEDEDDIWHGGCNGDIKLLMGFIIIRFMYNGEKPKFQVHLLGIPIVKKAVTKKANKKKKTAKENEKKEKSKKKHELIGLDFIKKFWTFLKDVIKTVKPKVFRIQGFYGFDDPSITGAICAVSGMVTPLIPACNINLTPVFDEESCDVKVHVGGGFSMIAATWKTLRFIFRKDIRKVIFKKHKKH